MKGIKRRANTSPYSRDGKILTFRFIHPEGGLIKKPKGRNAKRRAKKERKWRTTYYLSKYIT